MKIADIITEAELPKNQWVLDISNADKHELGTDLVDLVQTAYSNTPHGSFVNSIKDVIPSDWNVIDWDQDPDVDACVFYRRPRGNEQWVGNKIQGIGHDGSRGSKDRAIQKVRTLLDQHGWWIESSDAMRSTLVKAGADPVTNEKTLRKLFNDPDLEMIDLITYTRTLPTVGKIRETVFGKPTIK